MRLTATLLEEHRIIEVVLEVLDQLAIEAEDHCLDPKVAEGALHFLGEFADRCHHGRKEERLIAALEVKSPGNTHLALARMREEHDLGHQIFLALRDTMGQDPHPGGFARLARAYAMQVRQHMAHEERWLFPYAETTLSDSDKERLAAEFVAFDPVTKEPILHEKLIAEAVAIAKHQQATTAGPKLRLDRRGESSSG